jgi:hypothetical protein
MQSELKAASSRPQIHGAIGVDAGVHVQLRRLWRFRQLRCRRLQLGWSLDFSGPSVNELGAKGRSSTAVHADSGTKYLSIDSECSWTVTVLP